MPKVLLAIVAIGAVGWGGVVGLDDSGLGVKDFGGGGGEGNKGGVFSVTWLAKF